MGELKKILENYETKKNTSIDVKSFCHSMDKLIFITKQVLEHYKKKIENLEKINVISNSINNINETLAETTSVTAYNRYLKNNLKQRKEETNLAKNAN